MIVFEQHKFTVRRHVRCVLEIGPRKGIPHRGTYRGFRRSPDSACLRRAEKDSGGPAPATREQPPAGAAAFEWLRVDLRDLGSGLRLRPRCLLPPERLNRGESGSSVLEPDYARHETANRVD